MSTVVHDWAYRARDATVGDVPRAVAPTCYPRADLFARLPIHVLRDDILQRMEPASAKLLLALLSFVNHNGVGFPSRETLAKKSALSLPTVSRAINQLVELGAIIRIKGGGRDCNTYQVCREFASQERTALSPVPFAPAAKVDGRVNRDTAEIAPVTPQPSHQRHGSSVTGETPTRSIELEPLSSSKSQKPAAAASRVWLPEQSPEVRQKRALLSSAGVGNPTRDQIARTPEISVEDIRTQVDFARQHGKGPGAIVQNLRAVWDKNHNAAKRRAAAAAANVNASARPRPVDYDEVFAHLTHQRRRDLAREVYPGLSPEERADVDRWNWMNLPQSSVTMCRAMHRTLRERASGAPAGNPCSEPPCDAAPAVKVSQGAQRESPPVEGAHSTTGEHLGSQPPENRENEPKALNVDGVSALGGPPPGGEGPAAPERGEAADGGRDPPPTPTSPGGGGV